MTYTEPNVPSYAPLPNFLCYRITRILMTGSHIVNNIDCSDVITRYSDVRVGFIFNKGL